MDMNHLIGQRFNLISKRDIRYVGTLHEINPEASTIALENVVSFGTEGRRGNSPEEIPPSSSVYEYIVFRGSDVKDISVAEEKNEDAQPKPRVPDDPAILGTQPGPPPGPSHSQPPQQQPPIAHPTPPGYPQQPHFPGFYPPYGQRYGPPAFPMGPGFPNTPYASPAGWFPPGQAFTPQTGQFPPSPMPIGPPAPQQLSQQQQQHQEAPSVPSVNLPKPPSELSVSDKVASKPASRNITPSPATIMKKSPPAPVEPKPPVTGADQVPVAATVTASVLPAAPAQNVPASTAVVTPAVTGPSAVPSTPSKAPPTGPNPERVIPAIPIASPAKPSVPAGSNSVAVAFENNLSQGTAQAAITRATRAATAAVAAAMAKLPPPNVQKMADTNVDVLSKKMSEVRPFDGPRSQRGGYHPRGGRGGYRSQYPAQAKGVEVPDTDYDFESANAKFNKQDLVKEVIASGTPVPQPESHPVNGASEPADRATEESTVFQPTTALAYNKASSFFDNISSEARDREEGATGRRERRGEEVRKNIETFGQGSVDGYRGGYRGRGRGRGYSRGRGGYSRGYGHRGRGGFRGGRDASQSASVPAQI